MDSEVIRFYFNNYEAVAAKALQLYNKVIAKKNSEMEKQRHDQWKTNGQRRKISHTCCGG